MAFADRLKAERSRVGLSQAELADRAGMNRFGVAKLEQGHRHPTWETVQALAAALGTDCRAFMETATTPPTPAPESRDDDAAGAGPAGGGGAGKGTRKRRKG